MYAYLLRLFYWAYPWKDQAWLLSVMERERQRYLADIRHLLEEGTHGSEEDN